MKKDVIVHQPMALYKWAKNFKRIQDRFYDNKCKLRRLQQIEDFIKLNDYKSVYHLEETILDMKVEGVNWVNSFEDADLVVVTHQGYSRLPLPGIINSIKKWMIHGDIYLCLNRHYLNIDNQKIDIELNDDYQVAITQWLKHELETTVIDLSRDYIDYGKNFTWSIPDRHYFIKGIS
jgi:hypothetical protein